MDVLEEATKVVEARTAKLVIDSGSGQSGTYHGHYEGFGFRDKTICPDRSCKYYKYAAMWPVCTHPDVTWSVQIGGVYKCPKLEDG